MELVKSVYWSSVWCCSNMMMCLSRENYLGDDFLKKKSLNWRFLMDRRPCHSCFFLLVSNIRIPIEDIDSRSIFVRWHAQIRHTTRIKEIAVSRHGLLMWTLKTLGVRPGAKEKLSRSCMCRNWTFLAALCRISFCNWFIDGHVISGERRIYFLMVTLDVCMYESVFYHSSTESQLIITVFRQQKPRFAAEILCVHRKY